MSANIGKLGKFKSQFTKKKPATSLGGALTTPTPASTPTYPDWGSGLSYKEREQSPAYEAPTKGSVLAKIIEREGAPTYEAPSKDSALRKIIEKEKSPADEDIALANIEEKKKRAVEKQQATINQQEAERIAKFKAIEENLGKRFRMIMGRKSMGYKQNPLLISGSLGG